MRDNRRTHKWLILGIAGLASGLLTLFVFRSIPMASGTAAIAVVALIAAKHLALAAAVGSPLAALFQIVKSHVRPYCPWAPRN
jgi:hypothetical protein